MYKVIVCILLASVVARSVPVCAGAMPGTGIFFSVHDLTNGPNGSGPPSSVPNFKTDSQQRLCAYCHTPHHAIKPGDAGANGADYLPLWSHEVSTHSYSPYQSPLSDPSKFFDTHGGVSMSPDPLVGDSRLCMSCHDGVTAVDNYYGDTPGHAMTPLSSPSFPGQPIISSIGTTNHPIGFAMTDVSGPGASHPDPNIQFLTEASRYITGTAYSSPSIISRLYLGVIMTCSSCHDVHNTLNKTSGTDNYLLLGTQTGSGLCLSCHTAASGVSGTAHNWTP